MECLNAIRKQIDALDQEMLKTISRRMKLVEKVLKTKQRNKNHQVRNITREKKLLETLTRKAEKMGLDPFYVYKIFQTIIEYSLDDQHKTMSQYPHEKLMRVAYQGVEGAYSYMASRQFFKKHLGNCIFQGYRSFKEAVQACDNNECDYVVLPIENTIAGSINATYNLLEDITLFFVGEETWQIDHCLVGLEKSSLSNIKKISSHPQALLQCGEFLSKMPGCLIESYTDTAEAVRKIKEEGNHEAAAIASESAASMYGMKVLKHNIADQQENYTRFIVLGKQKIPYDKRVSYKSSMLLVTHHHEDALLSCLEALKEHGVNILKLESRPVPNMPSKYQFYIDIEGHCEDSKVEKAMSRLKENSIYVKMFGSYPHHGSAYDYADIVASLDKSSTSRRKVAAPGQVDSKVAVKPYKLAGIGADRQKTVVDINHVTIGNGGFVIIAGPCAVESYEQIQACAKVVRNNGGAILRGGVFKPRSSPYSFQGLGYEGLEYLVSAGKKYNMPIITEVLHPNDVKKVAVYSDVIQIGARNMQNYALLNEVGKCKRPVLLKRGMMASIQELLLAAEYIMSNGNMQVILCERGIRTFETATRNTLDLQAIPVLRHLTHLPIVVDPTHAAGNSDIIIPMTLAALAAGADGIMVEIHPEPKKALCDGDQALNFSQFVEMSQKIKRMEKVWEK